MRGTDEFAFEAYEEGYLGAVFDAETVRFA